MITFNQFLTLIEGKKKPNSLKTPPNAVPGTYREDEEGNKEYTLAPHTGPTKPIGKPKKIIKLLDDQGGIGGKAVKKYLKKK